MLSLNFALEKALDLLGRFMTLDSGDLLLTGTPHGVARLQVGKQLRADLADGRGTRLEMAFDVTAT